MKEYEYTGKAMGTTFSISIISPSPELADGLSILAIQKIYDYEKRFSRFIPTSELSLLNTSKDMIVSPLFLDVVAEAYRMFKATKGIFNPLVQIERMGYTVDFDTLCAKNQTHTTIPETVSDVPYDIDFSSTHIDTNNSRIILNEGQKIDVGGFLKGYLAEVLCNDIRTANPLIEGVVVNIGGDIHTKGCDATGKPFICTIYNPITQAEIPITLHNQSLATSGTYKRQWQQSEKHVHHILDASGIRNSENDIVSASVIHTHGSHAEAYAKVFVSVDLYNALQILSGEPFHYVIINKNGTVISNV